MILWTELNVVEGVAFMRENRIGHGVRSISCQRFFPRTEFDHQDIHTGNILFNHSNSRLLETLGNSGESDTPIYPFYSTFDFCMAFIDFECAVLFERDVEPLVHPNMVPSSHTAAPEQLKEDEEKYDMFSAEVFNLGRILQIEIQKARKVSVYIHCPFFFKV
jgi:serine/threonine protein kinase